jgi:uncharacterized membrane protein YphA (DoxX/SURF4 family)
MYTAFVITSALFATILTMSGIGKLRYNEAQMESLEAVGFPTGYAYALAAAEIAAAAGLVAGWFWLPLGIAAAVGTVLYFVGALAAHARARDAHFAPAAALLTVGIAVLTLAILDA